MATELLKLKLQQYGALRPEAWLAIIAMQQKTELKPDESFIRKAGTIAYIASGILKEYDAQDRKNPSIINFVNANQCLISRKHNQIHHLKACIPTSLLHWDFETLKNLYLRFEELKPIYDALCAEYDEHIAFRNLVLEEHSALKRIALFSQKYINIPAFLKKKDIANYLQLNYCHYLHISSRM